MSPVRLTDAKRMLPQDKYSLGVGFMACMLLVIAFVIAERASYSHTVSESRAVRTPGLFGTQYFRQESAPVKAMAVALIADQKMSATEGSADSSRKIVRKGSLVIVARDTDATSQRLQKIARDLGGYVVSAERNAADSNGLGATLSMRIPANRLDEAWSAIRQAASKVEKENMNADDVTKQYADMEATLRNYRAEEAQYIRSCGRQRLSMTRLLSAST